MEKALVSGQDAEVEELVQVLDVDYGITERDFDRADNFLTITAIVTIVLSVIISLIVFFGVTLRKKELKSKFMCWLKEFLNFRKMWIVGILKYVYILAACMTTIGGIAVMFYGGSEPWLMVLVGLGTVIFGNIGLRLVFELTMVTIGLWENTRDIRGVLVDKNLPKKENIEE